MHSSDSEDITSDDDATDDGRLGSRGRPPEQRRIGPQPKENRGNGAFITRQGSGQSLSSGSRKSSPSRLYERRTFTRSRSPAVHSPPDNATNGGHRSSSPSVYMRHRHTQVVVAIRSLFPSTTCIPFRIPFVKGTFRASFDTRQALENMLLVCSVGYAAVKIRGFATGPFDPDMWMSIELALLVVASIIYCTWTRVSWTRTQTTLPERPPTPPSRPASPRYLDGRENRRPNNNTLNLSNAAARRRDTGFVWMTVPKNYR
ncbi:hypothetical protein C8Q70DRAFT_663481 [Cubamyces menziesii]|nr:hypothetical protein C8Q70DRAFT_663481 [Cubamyces menziesii]